MEPSLAPAAGATPDPADWPSLRAQGHRMLDDIIDYLEHIRERPVWQPIPDSVRARFHGPVPVAPTELAAVHDEFMRHILPFTAGNAHPGFMGGVHGGGNPAGMLAEMLPAGLNAILDGPHQGPSADGPLPLHCRPPPLHSPLTAHPLVLPHTSI